MEKFNSSKILKNQYGQSTVEYILLLAVLTSLALAFFNNKRFKDFMSGQSGMFDTMRKGMSYTYRYGVEYRGDVDVENKLNYEYADRKHDTYLNSSDQSRFFTGTNKYGGQ